MSKPIPELRQTACGWHGRAPVSRQPLVLTLFIIVFGALIGGLPVALVWSGGNQFEWKWIPNMLFGVVVILVGLWLLVGTRDVIVKNGVLRVRYAVRPLGFSVRLAPHELTRLRVITAPKKDGNVFDAPYTLEARLKRAGQKATDAVPLAEGDDPAWLIAWCETLASALNIEKSIARDARRALEQDPDDGLERPLADVVFPEPGTGVPSTVESLPGHVTLRCRLDAEAKRRTRSYLGMGAFFIALPGGVLWFVLSGGNPGSGIVLGFVSVALFLGAIGLVMLGYALLTWWDTWIIDITNNRVHCTFRHLGRTRSRTFSAGCVRDVEVVDTGESSGGMSDSTGRSIGGTAVRQIRIDMDAGPSMGLMRGCSDASLQWVRGVLRGALLLDRSE